MSTDRDFDGKVAIVTGAGMGIGAAVATLLAERGARLVLIDRAEEALSQTQAQLREAGSAAEAVCGDITDLAILEKAVAAAIARFGRIDVLSNNAGIQRYGTLETTSDTVWDEVFDVNLKSIFRLSRLCIPHLKATRGAIVNMASVQGLASQANVAAYASAKHALIGLTRSAAVDYAPDGVRVNAVAPGSVDTPMLRNALDLAQDPASLRQEVLAMHPLGRMARSREVAEVVAFLASSRASFVTGAVYVVDGGLTVPLGGAPKSAVSTSSSQQFE